MVDPDPIQLRFSFEALTAHGYGVITAVDGRRGHAVFREHAPTLLVTEVLMPEMDGIELITAVRRQDPTTPILAVSGRIRFGTLELLDLAQHVGASATLPRPFSAGELASKVAELLEPQPLEGDCGPSSSS